MVAVYLPKTAATRTKKLLNRMIAPSPHTGSVLRSKLEGRVKLLIIGIDGGSIEAIKKTA